LAKVIFLSMLDKIIVFSFYLLAFLTPLVWTPLNYELFEYNKMIFVYLLTTIIIGSWALKAVNNKQFIINKTPLDIPILLFLLANILSTIFSIDTHISIWGYYSRSNGGLLSIICYILLYYAFVSNLNKDAALKVLKIGLIGGLIVSLWAIPEHFGLSPSCIILRGEFNATCWIQDVQARVFATLGQPNWLASYLSMLIFPALYFLLTSKKSLANYLLPIIYYLAFTFTYSRSGMIGFLVGLAVFLVAWTSRYRETIKQNSPSILTSPLSLVIISFLLINLVYGSALTRFQLAHLLKTSPVQEQQKAPVLNQLENGGTESGQIRLIVWRGALEIFKHYPLFGSGVETFGLAYYQFRPVEHNLVSEWDFLYNKAHNEFLNYLANTGFVGFATYLGLIITYVVWSIKYIVSGSNKSQSTTYSLLPITLLASYVAYQVQNFFGFSVVITALFFFLFPAIAFVTTNSLKSLNLKPLSLNQSVRKIFSFLLILLTVYLLFSILKIWYADTLFENGSKASETGNAGKAYNYLSSAFDLRKDEPFYQNELGYAAAQTALALNETDATLSGKLKDAALKEIAASLKTSPNNPSFYRTAIRTYYQLSELDPKFIDTTTEIINKTISLAPTDPKLYYNKAIILGQAEKNVEAIETLNKAISLKPNYREAYFALSLFLFDEGKQTEAVESMHKILQLVPGDPDALTELNDWGKAGIATASSETK